MKPELRPEGEAKFGLELGPGFPSPDPTTLDYAGYAAYIDTKMPKESPPLFGLHPNAEIGYLTLVHCQLILYHRLLGWRWRFWRRCG